MPRYYKYNNSLLNKKMQQSTESEQIYVAIYSILFKESSMYGFLFLKRII